MSFQQVAGHGSIIGRPRVVSRLVAECETQERPEVWQADDLMWNDALDGEDPKRVIGFVGEGKNANKFKPGWDISVVKTFGSDLAGQRWSKEPIRNV